MGLLPLLDVIMIVVLKDALDEFRTETNDWDEENSEQSQTRSVKQDLAQQEPDQEVLLGPFLLFIPRKLSIGADYLEFMSDKVQRFVFAVLSSIMFDDPHKFEVDEAFIAEISRIDQEQVEIGDEDQESPDEDVELSVL